MNPSLSSLTLGTSQFGLNYGIANTAGKPTFQQVYDILACAAENGISSLDMAALYGDSEETIGKALTELGLQSQFTVITKIPIMGDSFSSQEAIESYVEEAVMASMERLRLEQLPVCLFHAEANFCYIDALLKVRDKGLVKTVGSSVMTPNATLEILESGLAQCIQIPASALDQRFLRAGVMDKSEATNVTLLVRSIYLQGLLLMPEERIPTELSEVLPVRRALHELASQAGITPEELAMRFALGLPGVSSLVVGVDNAAQLAHNATMAAKGPLEPELHQAILDAVPLLPDNIVMPNQWSKRMPDSVAVAR